MSDQTSFDVALPCPQCGQENITGLILVGPNRHHQHTRYYCRTWGCGWVGWTVPADAAAHTEAAP